MPCVRVDVQSFRAPSVMAPDASHELPLHTAVSVRVPLEHDLDPERVYPLLQVGVHVAPSARIEVQPGPGAPFAGAADASHGFAEHVALVSTRSKHDVVPDTVYPELHVGWHVDPLASELVQSPAPPFDGVVDASHVVASVVEESDQYAISKPE